MVVWGGCFFGDDRSWSWGHLEIYTHGVCARVRRRARDCPNEILPQIGMLSRRYLM